MAPSPHAGGQLGHTPLLNGIPFFKQHLSSVSHCGCVGDSGTNSTLKLIPQVFSWVEVRNASRPFDPLHSQIMEVDSYFGPRLMMTSLVFPVREMPTHTITLSPPKAVTISVKQPTQGSTL